MNEMQNKLNRYYEEASIAPVKEEEDSKGYYYEKMFSSFCCPKKDSCREACRAEYRSSDEDPKFLFSPRTECVEVSQYYAEREYKGHRIPRIVVISLSVPKPELKPDSKPEQAESKPFSLNPHWRGTTTTIRSLLDPFIKLDPTKDDKSKKIIEKLFVHVRTAKCCSNVGGTSQEPYQLYENCGGYLGKEVSILRPDVIVTQGNATHDMAEQYVFEEGAGEAPVREVKGITDYDSIVRIVNLKEDNRRVYWLRSYFPYGRFYSQNHAGPKIDSESHIVGANRKNLVLYGQDIKKFMEER